MVLFKECNNCKIPFGKNGIWDMYIYGNSEELKKEQNRFLNSGLTIDEEKNLYYLEGYGAFINNVDNDINTVDEMLNKVTSTGNLYQYGAYRYFDAQGYKFVIGPGIQDEYGKVNKKGLYCSNYKEILE